MDKQALDRYLTAGLPEGDGYAEAAAEALTAEFFEAREDWFNSDPQCDKWLITLADREVDPKKAAGIIERAYRLFINRG